MHRVWTKGPGGSPLSLEVVERATRTQVIVEGELDADSVPLLRQCLATLGSDPLSLDCRGVSFIAVAGLHVLVEASSQRDVEIFPSHQVRRLVELCDASAQVRLADPECPLSRCIAVGGAGYPHER